MIRRYLVISSVSDANILDVLEPLIRKLSMLGKLVSLDDVLADH